MLIIAGFERQSADGNPKLVHENNEKIKYIFVGMSIIFLSAILTALVLRIFGAEPV